MAVDTIRLFLSIHYILVISCTLSLRPKLCAGKRAQLVTEINI